MGLEALPCLCFFSRLFIWVSAHQKKEVENPSHQQPVANRLEEPIEQATKANKQGRRR
jgi:hypothetical protein